MSGFLKMFTPKDRVFYSLFEELMSVLKEMAEAFPKALQIPDPASRYTALKNINDFEHRCDEITHRIFIELGQNFITPFDREDIHTLASALDDVADFIWGSAKRILNYGLEDLDDHMVSFAYVIQKSIASLDTGIRELRTMKNMAVITQCCVDVNSYENEADDLLDIAIQALFSSRLDAIEIIKRKDIYEELEVVTDKCEDAANVIETIIIKYS
jgi:predicted phosphate transport protein (TIGR00153 family)